MENVKYTLLVREYWNDFRSNLNRSAVTPSLTLFCMLPVYLNILLPIEPIMMLFLFPCALFLVFSMNTHVDLLPDMFYLLPLSRTQREQYVKRSMAVRVFIPGGVCMLWFGLLHCFLPLGTVALLMGCAGSILGCAVMHLSVAVEETHNRAIVFQYIGLMLVGLSFVASAGGRTEQILWSVVFPISGFVFWRLYRKIRAGCIRYSLYEAKFSEEKKK